MQHIDPHKIVEAILTDLMDRKGLEDAWESIDTETQEEIIGSWVKLIKQELKPLKKKVKKTEKALVSALLEAYGDLDHYYQATDQATEAIDLCIKLGYLSRKDGEWIYH